MANSELYDKTYTIPSDVLKYINTVLISNPNGNGVKRAKSLLKNGVVTYQTLKRLKNFFDNHHQQNGNETQYALAGGDGMQSFVETTLSSDRDAVSRSKKIRSDIHAAPNSELNIDRASTIGGSHKKGIESINENANDVTKNAVAIIVDNSNKMLLLKRGDGGGKDIWMPNKWSLVGGGVEKSDNNPEQAIKREILEETGLEIKEFIESFVIKREDTIEYIYVCRYNGEDYDIKLDFENSGYGWFSVAEINYLDTVPHLIEYITLVFKKYE